MRLPILAGHLRGNWWLAGSRGKVLRVLTGSYEPENTAAFERCVTPGAVVFDVGAHTGYFTLLSAALAGPTGYVCAFEPNPRNCRYLRRHVRINCLDRVRIEESAVADVEGVERFQAGTGSGTGRLGEAGALEVRTVPLDSFREQTGLNPTLIKIDVEGAELRVLRGARAVLQTDRPVIVLSTHGPEVHRECLSFLDAIDYQPRPLVGTAVDTTTELVCLPG